MSHTWALLRVKSYSHKFKGQIQGLLPMKAYVLLMQQTVLCYLSQRIMIALE